MMRSSISLVWKEYREQRWFLIAAVLIFCGFPLLEATGRYLRPAVAQPGFAAPKPEFYSDSAVGLVLGFGGLLAIFVAIGSTTRDLRDEVHVFWRSRPIGVGAWLGVKFAAGLTTVLIACTIPLLMQFAMSAPSGRHWSVTEVGGTIGIHSFAVVLIFSVAFLLGCLLRHATHAALLSLAAALVIYFLPVVLTPLAPLSVFNLMNDETFQLERNGTPNPAGWTFFLPIPGRYRVLIEPIQWSIFVAAMLGGSIAAVALALVAVRRDWRVAADRKAMHWSLGGVAMVLFGATAFQVGSNLKVLREFNLPLSKHTVTGLAFDGTRGVALLRDMSNVQYIGQAPVKLCSIEVTPDGARYGPVIQPTDKVNVPYAWASDVLFRRPQRPDRAYLLAEHSGYVSKPVPTGGNYEVTFLQLLTIDLSGNSADPVVHRLDLLPHLPELKSTARTYQAQDTLYVAGYNNVLAIDLSDGDAPRIARSIDVTVPGGGGVGRINSLWVYFDEATDAATGRAVIRVPLAALEGLSPRKRLDAQIALGMSNHRRTLSGDLLVGADGKTISTYRLTQLDEQAAVFELLGRREYTPLERLVGSYAARLEVIDGRVYAHESRMGNGISAYDVSNPERPTATGHFGVPNAASLQVARLATGELLLAANRLFVLEPPKRIK